VVLDEINHPYIKYQINFLEIVLKLTQLEECFICLSKYGDGHFMIFIETPLYKDLNVNIHHQWASLFILHMNLEFEIPIYNNASSDNFDCDNEKIHCTPTNSMIHNFLDIPKIMDHKNSIYSIAPSQNFHPVSLFKGKHSK
jgi:hypothetical protein